MGRATALRLASEGAKLAITDVEQDALAETETLIQSVGGGFVSIPGDITAPETIDRVARKAVKQFGTINALCNVAGILGLGGPIESYTMGDFDRVMHVNCAAPLLAIQRVVPEMRRAGKGTIVNVSSIGGLVGLAHMPLYCASKSALVGLTKAAAMELAPTIRCNAVCPGGIDTPMTAAFFGQFDEAERTVMMEKLVGRQMLKRMAKPEEIAEVILFLVSNRSSFLTGAIVPADAGHSSC